MEVKIDAMHATDGSGVIKYVPDSRKPLFFAVVGPDASGKINQSAAALVPAHAEYVGVKAWSSDKDEPSCTEKKTNEQSSAVRQRDEAGCLLMQMTTPTS